MKLMDNKCESCGARSPVISSYLSLCKKCLLKTDSEVLAKKHALFRNKLRLPAMPPVNQRGIKCNVCVNECFVSEGEIGYCGVRVNRNGVLENRAGRNSILAYVYLDLLPTNCVAIEYCPATTGAGYPKYAVSPRGEKGFYNLAVFLYGCNLDCLFCQNIQHKDELIEHDMRSKIINESTFLQRAMSQDVTCICYFGGDPAPQSLEVIYLSRKISEYASEKGLVKRICWETNGLENPSIMRNMALLSLRSGGLVKIDWKAWNPSLYTALTGINGEKALKRLKENVKLLAGLMNERREIPLLVVSVLLVPGYVDEEEVEGIASFIASLDTDIPLVLLAFYPQHLMKDLPTTSLNHALSCYQAAVKSGLKHVSIGNYRLLSKKEYE
jgi:pyruvate formate lyase activating enzyme